MSSDRFLRMDPNGWDRVRRVPQPVRRIHLGVNVGGLAWVEPAQTLHRGAAIVALAEWLAAEGYQVKVTSYWHSNQVKASGYGNALATCVVKDWAGVLNASAVVKVCTDIDFVRPLMLAARVRWANFTVSDGFGMTRDISEEQAKAMGLDVFAPSSILSKREAQRWFDQAKAQILAG